MYVVLAASVALLAVGCNSDDAIPATSPTPNAGTTPSPPPAPFEPSTVAQYLADGASTEVTPGIDRYHYTVTTTLPTGNKSITEYSLDPRRVDISGKAEPDISGSQLREFVVSYELTDQGFEWNYSYFIPADQFPSGALASSSSRLSTDGIAAFIRPAIASADGSDGVQIVASGVVKSFTSAGMSTLEEEAGLTSAPATTGVGSVLDVADAASKSSAYRQIKKRLADLRKCAENPTDPLVRQQYRDDPGARQKLLEAIDEEAVEMKSDMAVRFVGMLDSSASGLAGAKWVGVVLGPALSWADSSIAHDGQKRLDELAARVTKCEGGAVLWSGTITYAMDENDHSETDEDTSQHNHNHTESATTIHYKSSISVNGLAIPYGIQGASGRNDNAHEEGSYAYEDSSLIETGCGDGQTIEDSSVTKLNGTTSNETAHVFLTVSGTHYSLTASNDSLLVNGETHTEFHNPGGYCRGPDPSNPPIDDVQTTAESRDGLGPEVSVTGEMENGIIQGSKTDTSPDGTTVTTITWELHQN